MGVNPKHRRKITVDGQKYLWYIAPDGDGPFDCLNIFSEDKRLVLCCPLKTTPTYLISKGRAFQGKQTSGCWERYLLPFCVPQAVTPKFISELILWAVQGKKAVSAVWDQDRFPV